MMDMELFHGGYRMERLNLLTSLIKIGSVDFNATAMTPIPTLFFSVRIIVLSHHRAYNCHH